MHIKKTWEICSDKDIESMFNEVWNYVSLNYDLDDCPYLFLNKANSIHTLGLFHYDNVSNQSCIVLNKLFLKHKDKVLNTIVHEFAHYVAWKKYDDHLHDRRWQQIGNQLGIRFNESILPFCASDDIVLQEAKRLKPKRQMIKHIYEVTCDYCNHVFRYKKQRKWFKNKRYVSNQACSCPYCGNHEFRVEVK